MAPLSFDPQGQLFPEPGQGPFGAPPTPIQTTQSSTSANNLGPMIQALQGGGGGGSQGQSNLGSGLAGLGKGLGEDNSGMNAMFNPNLPGGVNSSQDAYTDPSGNLISGGQVIPG